MIFSVLTSAVSGEFEDKFELLITSELFPGILRDSLDAGFDHTTNGLINAACKLVSNAF